MSDTSPAWMRRLPTLTTEPTISMRQVIAYNLAHARKSRGLSQQELAEELYRVTGQEWTNALVSAAESGWSGSTGRVRSFDATDVVAFSLALRLPIAWFFLPPTETPDEAEPPEGSWIRCGRKPDSPAITSESLRHLALAKVDPEDESDLMAKRLQSDGGGGDPVSQEVAGQVYELFLQIQKGLRDQLKESE